MININEKLLDELNDSEYFLLSMIARYGKKCCPSNSVLCHKTSWGMKKLQNTKKELTKKDLLVSSKRWKILDGKRVRDSNEYLINTNLLGKYNGKQPLLDSGDVVRSELVQSELVQSELIQKDTGIKVLKLLIIEKDKLLKKEEERAAKFFLRIKALEKELGKKKLAKKTPTTFKLDSARELIYERFGGVEKAVENVAIEYKQQTGFDVDDSTIQTSIASFLQKGMVEHYLNLTRADQVIAKLMAWITNQVQYQKVNGYNKQQKDNEKLDYEKYYLESMKAIKKKDYDSAFEHITKYGILKAQIADFNSKVDSLRVIREKYFSNEEHDGKYKNVSIYLIYDLMYTKFPTHLTGLKELHLMRSLARFVDDLSPYNQTQGKLKVLLDKAYDRQHS